jgi:protein-S-isoprenylcysteine O-methyltransferase Ste14
MCFVSCVVPVCVQRHLSDIADTDWNSRNHAVRWESRFCSRSGVRINPGSSIDLETDGNRPRGRRISRRALYFVCLAAVPVAVPLIAFFPWVLSQAAPRWGWTDAGPAPWNLCGLAPIVSGASGLIWVLGTIVSQFGKLPAEIDLQQADLKPPGTSRLLITQGPFAWSRNPLYLTGLTMLFGWAVFYGSFVILVVVVVGWLMQDRWAVPQEERAMEARYGDEYRAYKARVPRWLPLPGRRG